MRWDKNKKAVAFATAFKILKIRLN